VADVMIGLSLVSLSRRFVRQLSLRQRFVSTASFDNLFDSLEVESFRPLDTQCIHDSLQNYKSRDGAHNPSGFINIFVVDACSGEFVRHKSLLVVFKTVPLHVVLQESDTQSSEIVFRLLLSDFDVTLRVEAPHNRNHFQIRRHRHLIQIAVQLEPNWFECFLLLISALINHIKTNLLVQSAIWTQSRYNRVKVLLHQISDRGASIRKNHGILRHNPMPLNLYPIQLRLPMKRPRNPM